MALSLNSNITIAGLPVLHHIFLNIQIPISRYTLNTVIRNPHADCKDRHQNRQHDGSLVVDEGKALRITVLQVRDQHLRTHTDEQQGPEGKDLCIIDQIKKCVQQKHHTESDH